MEKLTIKRKIELFKKLSVLNNNYTKICIELGYPETTLPNWKDVGTSLTVEIKNDLFNGVLDGTIDIPDRKK